MPNTTKKTDTPIKGLDPQYADDQEEDYYMALAKELVESWWDEAGGGWPTKTYRNTKDMENEKSVW